MNTSKTAATSKSVIGKLIDLFRKLQTLCETWVSEKGQLQQEYQEQARKELLKEATTKARAEARRLRAKSKQKAVASALAAGLGSYAGGYSTESQADKTKKTKRLKIQEPTQWGIEKLAWEKYCKADAEYLTAWGKKVAKVAKEIDLTLVPAVQEALQSWQRAKNTLLTANWEQIMERLSVREIIWFQTQGLIKRTIDSLEFIKADVEFQGKIEVALRAKPQPPDAFSETQKPVESKPTEAHGGKKITKEEANVRARELIKENPNYTIRKLAEKIPCSTGLASQLPACKALQEYKKKTFGNRRPKVIPLTKELEACLGSKDDQLQQLIAEQAEDDKQGPRLYVRKHT